MNTDLTIPRHEIDPGRLERMRSELQSALLPDATRPGAVVRHSPRIRRLTVGLGAAAAVGALATVLATSVLTTTPVWAATPDTLTGPALAQAAQDCQRSLGRLPNAAQLPQSPSAVGERRGSTTSTLLTGSSVVGLCVGDGGARYGGVVDAAPTPADSGGLEVMAATALPGENPTGLLLGRVGSGVASVEVRTADGRTVTATTSAGYFLAWWPSSAAAETVTALSSDGTTLAHLDGPALSPGSAPEPQRS